MEHQLGLDLVGHLFSDQVDRVHGSRQSNWVEHDQSAHSDHSDHSDHV